VTDFAAIEAARRYALRRYAAATTWRTWTQGVSYPPMTDERPDPLAEPEHWARSRAQPQGPDLTVCAHHPDGTRHCTTPPVVILWVGCTRGEHAGPLSFCAHHATWVGRGPLHCAQCGGEVRVMKITSMDGVTTVGYPEPPGPPDDLWRAAAPGR